MLAEHLPVFTALSSCIQDIDMPRLALAAFKNVQTLEMNFGGRNWVPVSIAMAQDVAPVIPPVPTTGVSPLVQWLLGTASVVITAFLPIALMYLRQHVQAQTAVAQSTVTATNAALLNGAITRAASQSLLDQANGKSEDAATTRALDYVKTGHPDVVADVDQATDPHLRAYIQAVVAQMQRENTSPVVNVTPMPVGRPLMQAQATTQPPHS